MAIKKFTCGVCKKETIGIIYIGKKEISKKCYNSECKTNKLQNIINCTKKIIMIEIVVKEDLKGKIYFEATEGGGILHWDYSLKNL